MTFLSFFLGPKRRKIKQEILPRATRGFAGCGGFLFERGEGGRGDDAKVATHLMRPSMALNRLSRSASSALNSFSEMVSFFGGSAISLRFFFSSPPELCRLPCRRRCCRCLDAAAAAPALCAPRLHERKGVGEASCTNKCATKAGAKRDGQLFGESALQAFSATVNKRQAEVFFFFFGRIFFLLHEEREEEAAEREKKPAPGASPSQQQQPAPQQRQLAAHPSLLYSSSRELTPFV